MLRHWSQFVPNMSTDIRGHEALQHHHVKRVQSMQHKKSPGPSTLVSNCTHKDGESVSLPSANHRLGLVLLN